MSQQIQCPHCGQSYALTDEQAPQYAGQTITCTRCQKPFTVSQNLASAGAPQPATPPPPGARQPTAPYPPPQAGMPVNYASYGYQTAQTSGLAIASLVLSIIGLLLFPAALVGIVLGIVALTKMKDPRVGGRGLAIGGIAVGAVSIVLSIVIVGCMMSSMSTLLPSLNRARETANRVKCASNMRQIGQALLLYSNDNRGAYPPKIEVLLTTQDITAEVFDCPSSNDTPAPGATPQQQAAALNTPGHLSYVYVGANLNNQASPETVVVYEPLTNHGGDGANFLWGDGHVTFESKNEAKRIIDQVSAGQNPPSFPTRGSR